MGKALFISKKQNTLGPSRTLIIGEPGSGKTKLAATWPEPLFLDSEFGAGSTGANRLLVRPGPDALPTLKAVLKKLGNAEYRDGALWMQLEDDGQIEVRTLVIDSIDAFQQGEKQRIMEQAGVKKMRMNDWGTLLDNMTPVMHMWSGLPIHVIVIAHVKESHPDDSNAGYVGLAVQGSFKDTMPRWFDYIIHLRGKDMEKRRVITAPVTVRNTKYLAKDRHGLFDEIVQDKGEEPYFDIEMTETGLPAPVIRHLIDERHVLGKAKKGTEADARVYSGDKTKTELLRIAREEAELDATGLAELLKNGGFESFKEENWDAMGELVRGEDAEKEVPA